MYADAELEASEAARLEEHLVGCVSCAARVAALKRESHAIRAALRNAGELPKLWPDRFERATVEAAVHGDADAQPVAELAHAEKRFGNVVALRGLDLAVRRGELLGVLGPNGAGKSTAILLLLGLLRPDSGRARLFGRSPEDIEVRRQIGVMLQGVALTPELRVRELIELATHYYPDPMRIDEVLAVSNTTSIAHRAYGKLSVGQQRLVQFSLAICGRARLLFLDEPTAGLDVDARERVWAILRGLVAQGVSIVLTTHYLEEAESLSTRVAVLAQGRLIVEDTVAGLRRLIGAKQIDCVTATNAMTVASWPEVASVTRDERGLHVKTLEAEATVRRLLAADGSLAELEVRRAALADAFKELTRGVVA